VPDTPSFISTFALSDGSNGPPFSNPDATASIQELGLPTLVGLSGKLDDKDLPVTNHIARQSDSRTVFALAPDQWLLHETNMDAETVMAEVRMQYAGKTIVCTDHSQAWTALRLSGSGAAKALSHLCPVDLHPTVFGADTLFQTNMAGIPVLCTRSAGQDNSYDLYLPYSYSRSFYEALRDAVEIG